MVTKHPMCDSKVNRLSSFTIVQRKGQMSEIGRSVTSAPYRELFLNKRKVATKRNVQFDIIQLTFIPNWVEPAVVSQL